ncbi:MAG: alpha/beta hydrolase [Acidobacteria bacterium]|nr:alpha/beta hydrolase [Acidobacteriota bacterium]
MSERPLVLWAHWTRQVLAGAGLRKTVVETPVGVQTVFVGGTGPVLVLLHGAGSQAGTWSSVAGALASSHTLVVPDLAGHGESAPLEGPIPVETVYAALEGVVGPHARRAKVTVVGNSLGAWMALQLAHRHPDWVEGVVAVDGGALKGTHAHARLLPKTREEARASYDAVMDPGAPRASDALLDDMVLEAREGPLARFAGTADSMEPWVLDEAQLKALRVPVGFIWGSSDRLLTLDYARRHLDLLPDARLVVLERCGHMPQQEAPAAFLEALGGILGNDAPPARM